jgi:hypothetical protein
VGIAVNSGGEAVAVGAGVSIGEHVAATISMTKNTSVSEVRIGIEKSS